MQILLQGTQQCRKVYKLQARVKRHYYESQVIKVDVIFNVAWKGVLSSTTFLIQENEQHALCFLLGAGCCLNRMSIFACRIIR